MKIFFVYIFLFILIIAFDIAVDLLSGLSLPMSIRIVAEAFSASTVTEKALIALALPAPALPSLYSLLKNKKRNTAGRE
ncbi:hypothetical protein FE782_09915 [Paenibacillus antri]|uniref:Uncharacterized protein n=1 Tax=Paenibacillus antri TaxID=2582848 RepID=A0A5R9GHM8_9BACL|nr:hypothetical protein [Paenibacillus antri]TLS52283.1 hypothetical protein FE782_09915 [Paenibacillus antri]